jgi:hypothetical protein
MRKLAGKVAVITAAIAASVSPPHSGSSPRGRTSSSPADGHVSSRRRRRQEDNTSRSARRACRTGHPAP